jgi:hypothetical protein
LTTPIDADHPRRLGDRLVPCQGVARQCSRTGCSEAATVTLTYQYSLAQVWLDGLAVDRDPHAYDLCRRHADHLTAPQGWHVRDRRPTAHPSQNIPRTAYVA